ncbi:Tetratricopeptide repeat [Hirschfeldia incana]|nr:Tetratricopeptide repeat [Hirschfeldia incana]
MGVKVATTSIFHHLVAVHHSQTLVSSAVSSPSRRRSLSCQSQSQRLTPPSSPPPPPLFGSSTNLRHSKSSCELLKSSRPTKTQLIRRAFSGSSVDPFSEEEFAKKMQELSLKFQEDNETTETTTNSFGLDRSSSSVEPPWPEMVQMSTIERKANSVDLPISLRIIKRKLQMEEGVVMKQVGESAVKRAFSSMVFMIRELQSFTLHMRELLLFEDLQGILLRVRKEMHASFVWLFQQVFSATPTLMVSVMILLANFTVYSIGSNSALAAVTPPTAATVSFRFDTTEISESHEKFDSSMIKTLSVSSPNGKTSFVGGGGNGGNNVPPVQSGTDGDGSDQFRTPSQFSSSSLGSTAADSEVSVSGQEESRLWNSILEETEKMEALDHDTMKQMVAPVEARLEAEESMDYFKTELLYQTGLSQQPDNVLLLANYAQFLYLIIHDYDRAEKYFKRAAKAEPADAEALSKYATFLWKARNDIWRAEETFLEAISADPTNSFYSANYAHFLWNTGGDETCFPLDAPPQQNTT